MNIKLLIQYILGIIFFIGASVSLSFIFDTYDGYRCTHITGPMAFLLFFAFLTCESIMIMIIVSDYTRKK